MFHQIFGALPILLDITDPLSRWILTNNLASILFFLIVFSCFLFLAWFNSSLKIKVFGIYKDQGIYQKTNKETSLNDKHQFLLIAFLGFNLLIYSLVLGFMFYGNQVLYPLLNNFSKFIIFITAILFLMFFGESLPAFRPSFKPVNKAEFLFIKIITKIFTPIIAPLLWMDGLLDKYVMKREKQLVLEEINEILEEPENVDEKEILRGIFNFSHITVKQIMKPRLEFIAFPQDLNFHELLNKINKFAYSRIPVYAETFDKIEGILYIKDLLPYINKDENFRWQRLIRPAYFVLENKKIEELLRNFQLGRVHMAIVVDEYGGTAGLVTLEDIIEQIIGDLQDEFDDEELLFKQISDNTYIFEGKTTILDFCKVLNIDIDLFDSIREDAETVAGLVLEIFGNFPKVGDKINFGNFNFSIISANNKKIRKVQLEILKMNNKGNGKERIT